MKKEKGIANACKRCTCFGCQKSCLCWACDANKPGYGPMIATPCNEKENLEKRGQ